MLALEQPVTGHDLGGDASINYSRPPLEIVPFEPWHLEWLQLQASQLGLAATLTMDHGRSLQHSGPCQSAWAGMEVVACAGIIELWHGRSQVWSLLSGSFPCYAKSIHRAVRDFLDSYRCARLECVVDPRAPAAIRWAEHLGFQYESTMPKYTPSGETQLMMVRLE